MVKIVILDDESNAVETLKWKVEKFCKDVEVVETFVDPLKALVFLQTQKIDLLFIDIEMPKLNGFELLQTMDSINFDVVFTTAYDEFGIRAIKFSALDYLLKPIQPQELVEAVEKHKNKNANQITSEQLKVLFSNIKEEEKGPVKIALSTKESIEFVRPEDIIACTSDSNYTMVYLKNGRKKLISKTLKEFDELLSDHHFFRSHHSFLVNTKHIKEYVRSEGGYLLMSNDMQIPVSRSKKEELLKLF
jgi:two-component system LytT family response regulator